jgi:plasmid stabilization system protein ParE
MSLSKVIIRKRAENHLEEAYNYYELQRPALGAEFLLSVEVALNQIQKSPLIFPQRHNEIRCAFVPRFPYGIFYLSDNDKIIVFACFHLSRNPRNWHKLK